MDEMSSYQPEIRQRGIVMPVVAISMFVLIGMSGVALDLAHGYLDKARMETAVDAAALAGAKVVNELGNTAAAQQEAADAAVRAFNFHLEGDIARANAAPDITFSTTLAGPFGPLPVADARYIRATLTDLPATIMLARVVPGVADQLTISASAVAGPSPPLGTDPDSEICEIAPLLVCGEPGVENFGYEMGAEEEQTLKTHSGNSNEWEVGKGNFQLIELDCGPGGSCVREELAGGYSGCTTDRDTVTTKPGDTVGPTAQGFNTRFNKYLGAGMNPDDHPPDTVTTEGIWHAAYEARQGAGPHDVDSLADGGYGVPGRRILVVPFGDCTGTVNGQGEVPVLGFGCFFMTRQASHKGNTQEIFGQFIEECEAAGDVAEVPVDPGGGGPVLYKIILYNDMASNDS